MLIFQVYHILRFVKNSLIRRVECNIMITCIMLYGECALMSDKHMQSSSGWADQDITTTPIFNTNSDWVWEEYAPLWFMIKAY